MMKTEEKEEKNKSALYYHPSVSSIKTIPLFLFKKSLLLFSLSVSLSHSFWKKSNKKQNILQNTIRGSALLFSCPDRPVVRRACGVKRKSVLSPTHSPTFRLLCFETLSITLGGDTFLEKFGKETKQKIETKSTKASHFDSLPKKTKQQQTVLFCLLVCVSVLDI